MQIKYTEISKNILHAHYRDLFIGEIVIIEKNKALFLPVFETYVSTGLNRCKPIGICSNLEDAKNKLWQWLKEQIHYPVASQPAEDDFWDRYLFARES
jgi:hypothetical protein